MAAFPCDFCGDRYRGRQQTAYPALVSGTDRISRKMRLCPKDFDRIVHLPWLSPADSNPVTPWGTCSMCGALGADWAVFVPYYEDGQARADLWASVCDRCSATSARMALFGVSEAQEPLPGL